MWGFILFHSLFEFYCERMRDEVLRTRSLSRSLAVAWNNVYLRFFTRDLYGMARGGVRTLYVYNFIGSFNAGQNRNGTHSAAHCWSNGNRTWEFNRNNCAPIWTNQFYKAFYRHIPCSKFESKFGWDAKTESDTIDEPTMGQQTFQYFSIFFIIYFYMRFVGAR